MNHVRDLKEIMDSDTHYDGCGLIGSHTLCGITDLTRSCFAITSRRVNCKGCIAVRDHVKGKSKKVSAR